MGRLDGPAQDRDGVEVLTQVEAFELAALAGFVLAAAALRVPVLLDGVIACSAALAAARLQPAARILREVATFDDAGVSEGD